MGKNVADRAMQVLGGNGYVAEYQVRKGRIDWDIFVFFVLLSFSFFSFSLIFSVENTTRAGKREKEEKG